MQVGLEGYIAQLSMSMAQQSVSNQASVKMLDNTLEDSTAIASKMIQTLDNMSMYGNVGGMFDISA